MGTPLHAIPASPKGVLRRLPRILLPAVALPVLTYVVPGLNPFKVPHIDLTGPLAVAAYWVAESGSPRGIPLIGIALTALLVSRPEITLKQRAVEAFVIALSVTILLGHGAYVNEHVIKPVFAVPRPNILELAQTPPEPPVLKMSAEAFYALPDKNARSKYLQTVLTPAFRLHERVREHWIAETGFSFPSDHSFAAMMFATFFLAMGLSHFSDRRLWVFYLLAVWAVAVCFSRPILRVHSPTDVCIGSLEGTLAGILAYLLVRRIVAVLLPVPTTLPAISANSACEFMGDRLVS
jgi:phosphatidylglycerophosphatase B